MKNKKVHLNGEYFNSKACNKLINYTSAIRFKEFYNLPKEQQCQSCLKTKYYQEQVQKMESERKASSEELGIKTQLQLDRFKYNLNDEQVEILSKVDYELVVLEKLYGCDDCLLKDIRNDCGGDVPCTNLNGNLFFKQIHKTQKSLNESIEKEEVENGIEEPFMGNINKLKEDIKEIIYNSPGGTIKINRIKIEPPKYNPEDVAFNKGIPGFKKTLDDMYSIMLAKNSDYAGSNGAFDNFNRVEQIGLVTAEKGLLVRIMDKVGRAVTLLDNKAKVNDEAIEDTVLDMANYAVILKCLIESKRIKKEMK